MMTSVKQCALFAQTVLIEARSFSTIFSAVIILLVAVGIALFSGEVAIVETRQTQAGMAAAFLRLALLFFVSLFTINSLNREMNDRLLLLYLSLPVSRAVFVLGKFSGFALIATIFAVCAMGVLILFGELQAVSVWALSLLLEAWLIIGFSVLCAFSLGQMTSAFAAVVGIYFTSRSLSAIVLMAQNPLRSHEQTFTDEFIQGMLNVLDYLLPRLDRFTRSEWVMYGEVGMQDLVFVGQQALIYLILLLSVAFVDFYRKSI